MYAFTSSLTNNCHQSSSALCVMHSLRTRGMLHLRVFCAFFDNWRFTQLSNVTASVVSWLHSINNINEWTHMWFLTLQNVRWNCATYSEWTILEAAPTSPPLCESWLWLISSISSPILRSTIYQMQASFAESSAASNALTNRDPQKQ